MRPLKHRTRDASQDVAEDTTIFVDDDAAYNSKHFVIPPQYAVRTPAKLGAEIDCPHLSPESRTVLLRSTLIAS